MSFCAIMIWLSSSLPDRTTVSSTEAAAVFRLGALALQLLHDVLNLALGLLIGDTLSLAPSTKSAATSLASSLLLFCRTLMISGQTY